MKRLKRNLHTEEHIDEEGSWAISYGDMITVLMSFFILYFSMDPKEHDDKLLTQSLVAALQQQELPKDIKNYIPESIRLGKEVDGESLDEKIIKVLGAKITRIGVKLIVEFPEVSFFDSGKIDIRPDAHQALVLFVQRYLPYSGGFNLGVQAYTDKTPVKFIEGRRFRDNLELSALRSVAAMRTLQHAGIPINDMKLSGFGEYRKIFKILKENSDPKDYLKLSRKVVLVIEPKDKEVNDEKV